METSEPNHHGLPQPDPWVYRPEQWDQEELKDLYQRRPPPKSMPQEMELTLVGEGGNTSSLILASTENAFRIQSTERRIPYSHIRYVTTNCHALCSGTETDRFVIMMSIRQVTQGDAYDVTIVNMFIRPESAESAMDVLNFLLFHIFKFLQFETAQKDPSVLQQYLRPLIVSEFEMQVHFRKEGKTWEKRQLLILDQECVALYTKPYEESPEGAMFFWRERHDRSCAKVSRFKSAECIFFQSRHMYIVIGTKQNMVAELEKTFRDSIQSITQRAFEDPRTMLMVLRAGDAAAEGVQDDYEERDVQLDVTQQQKLDILEKELNQGVTNAENSQWHKLWDNIRPSLELELVDNTLPIVDEDSWHYQPENVDHLLSVLRLIQEEIFMKVDYKKALATTRAMKSFFGRSSVTRISWLMQETCLDLLRKIGVRGNVPFGKSSEADADLSPEQQQGGDGPKDLIDDPDIPEVPETSPDADEADGDGDGDGDGDADADGDGDGDADADADGDGDGDADADGDGDGDGNADVKAEADEADDEDDDL